MTESERDIRLQIMLLPEELRAIEDWRFSRRMPSRAAAVRELLRRGLSSERVELADAGRHSSDYGVNDDPDRVEPNNRSGAK